MQIHPIFNQKIQTKHQNFCGKHASILELLHRNYTLNMKSVTDKIMRECTQTSANGFQAVYNIIPAGMPPQIPAAGIVKSFMEIAIDRSKKLIESIKIMSGKTPNFYLEETRFTYNKKGQIIRVLKQTTSPNGIKNDIKTNIKYEDNRTIIKKYINDGEKQSKTIITSEDGKKTILKFARNNINKRTERFKYMEGKTIYSTVATENSGIKFEAYGDPETGEMVFSSNTLNPTIYGEYIEQLSNGSYIKQVLARNGSVITREIPPSVADNFIHQRIDLLTPENEILTKLEEFGL